MELGYSTILEQSQIMSQNQIQSLQILAMDNTELSEYLQNEYLENPMLEYVSAGEEPREESAPKAAGVVKTESYKAWNEGVKGYDVASEDPMELKHYLLDQVNRLEYTAEENTVMEFLVECLDSSGFFTMSSEDVASMISVPVEVVDKCLGVM